MNMWQKYNLDSKRAKKFYLGDVSSSQTGFAKYSPAYLGSNESVREIVNYLGPRDKTVLSVIGSADIPLYLSAHGARYVDTFDISINAYLAMRLKMHMMRENIDIERYKCVLNNLSAEREFTKIWAWEFVYDAFKNDNNVLKYLYGMDGCGIFGSVPVNPYWTMNECEYNLIKSSLPNHYNFIWSDLYNLPNKISGKKYDIIYLSNILQYAKNNKVILNTVNKLHPHLNEHGTIVLDSLVPIYEDEYEFLNDKLDWAKTEYNPAAATVFLKTR